MCSWPDCERGAKKHPFCSAHMRRIPRDLRRVLLTTTPGGVTNRAAVDAAIGWARDLITAKEVEAARNSAWLADQGVLW